jgi:HK97 family phage portal protein
MDPGTQVGLVDLNLGKIAGRSPSDGGGRMSRLTQRGSKRYLSAYGGNQAMDWVMDCVRFTGDTVANAEYHFETPKDDATIRVPGDPVNAPELLRNLLEKPNPYMDYIEMMELLVQDLLLTGNAYWFKWRTNASGQPLALYRLAPPYVEIGTTAWGPGQYIYQIPNAAKIEIERSEVMHFRLSNPDPENPFYGCGILQGAGRAADLDLALTDTQASYMENRAMPSIAVESERRVPRDVFKKIRAQLRARAAGPRNAGELLVLEAGLKLSSVAPSAQDAAFAELSRMDRDRVFSWFRMNPKLLGITDESTAESLREAQQHFDAKTARPLMNKIQTKITSELVAAWNLKYAIDYEYQLTPEEQAHLAGAFGLLPGIIVNELRKVAGLGPHPDKRIGEMTINLPGEQGGTGQPGDTPSRNGFPDPGLPGQPGRPPRFENTKPFPKPGQPLPAGAAVREGKAAQKAMTLDEVMARLGALEVKAATETGGTLSVETRVPDQLEAKRTAEVDEITTAFEDDLQSAAEALERALLDPDAKASPNNAVLKLRNSPAWKTFKEKVGLAYERHLLKVMSAAAVHHGEIGLKPAGEIDYEALVDDLVRRKDSGVAAITKTFKNMIADRVKEGRTAGSSTDDIQTDIKAAVADWISKSIPAVALTEATRAYNESTLAVADESGYKHVMVSDGHDSDEACAEADGQVWTLANARAHAIEHPRCRRAFVPVAV